MIKNIFNFKTIVLAFVGMVCLGVHEAQAAVTVAEVYLNGSSTVSAAYTDWGQAWAAAQENALVN